MSSKFILNAFRPRAGGTSKLHVPILTVLLVCSVALNVMLSSKVRQLTTAWEEYRAQGRLAVGAQVPAIKGKDLTGGEASLAYGEGEAGTVLYVFSPQCKWCSRNINNMKALAGAVRGKYRFVGLSLSKDKLAQYVTENRLDFPVYADLQGEVVSAYHLGATPQTLLISPEGRVEKSWTGVYTSETGEEIEHLFKLKLPGVLD
jgi:peroxiredoxin